MTRIRWITAIVAVVIVGLGVLFAVNLGDDPTKVSNPTLHEPAPNFTLKTFDNKQVDLTKLQGKVVMVNFWNEWCDPCKAETPSLVALAKAHKDDPGFQMVGIVHLANTQRDARAYAAQHKMDYPLAFDPGSRTSLDYGVTGQPETFIIDKAGIVNQWVSGPIDANRLERDIERLEAT
jgi:cytochrome c biogenesis protein CcmG/thiol:disulfide interchange protein DsbE